MILHGRETKRNIKIQGIKDKKMHEVRQICPYIRSVWQRAGINTVIDIGAGQGYISEVDALKICLYVVFGKTICI